MWKGRDGKGKGFLSIEMSWEERLWVRGKDGLVLRKRRD